MNDSYWSCHFLWLTEKALTKRVYLRWCVCTTVSAAEKSAWHSSGQEQKCRRCFGDGLDVLFVVTATIGEHQVIYDSHDTHEWQEEENAFPEQEARSAVRHTSRISVNKSGMCKTRLGYNTWLMCLCKAISRVETSKWYFHFCLYHTFATVQWLIAYLF